MTAPETAGQAAYEADVPCQAAPCEHHWVSQHAPDHAIYWVRICSLCGEPDWDDLDRQIDELADASPVAALKAVPGDTVILTFGRRLDMSQAHEIRERFAVAAPGINLVVVDSSAEAAIAAAAPAADDAPIVLRMDAPDPEVPYEATLIPERVDAAAAPAPAGEGGAFWEWMDAYVDEPHNAQYEVPDMQRAYEAGRAVAAGVGDRLLDWAAHLITTATEEADVLSAPWRSEQQDWLNAYKATPRQPQAALDLARAETAAIRAAAANTARELAALADALDAEADEDIRLSSSHPDGTSRVILAKRADHGRQIASRIRRAAGIEQP